jgi:hypothetical protein
MNKKISLLVYPLLIIVLANWSSSESSGDGYRQHRVNFYGTIYTCHEDGRSYTVDNISLSNLIKQIPLYEIPSSIAPAGAEHKSKLTSNPRKGIITRLDLSEISEIIVPEPEFEYFFQEKKGAAKTNYIEIEIVYNCPEQKEASYLIETTRKILCNEINPAGPVEKEFPVQSFCRLIIRGYKNRDEEEKKMRNYRQAEELKKQLKKSAAQESET